MNDVNVYDIVRSTTVCFERVADSRKVIAFFQVQLMGSHARIHSLIGHNTLHFLNMDTLSSFISKYKIKTIEFEMDEKLLDLMARVNCLTYKLLDKDEIEGKTLQRVMIQV